MKTHRHESISTVARKEQSSATACVAWRVASIVATLAILTSSAATIQAATIDVPNGSFELQPAAGQPQGVNINVDSWQKAPKPAYFDAIEQNFGIFWIQTAGVFVDPSTNAYANRLGDQAAYLLPYSQVTLFQDLSTPGATYEAGMSYTFTLGVFGKGMVGGETLQLSLFYRDGLNNMVTVGDPTTVTYSTAAFPLTSPLNLIDYSVTIGEVLAGDAWAGRNIGLKIESTATSTFANGQANWDIDNVRLTATAVPEPAALSLLALGLGGWCFLRARARRA